MDSRTQMEWVIRNRTRRVRTITIGKAVTEFAENLQTRDIEPLEKLAAALDQLVDDEFRTRCRVAGWSQGVLRICVDDPAQVSLMRIQWGSRIKRELPRILRSGKRSENIRTLIRVVFYPGAIGTTIGNADRLT